MSSRARFSLIIVSILVGIACIPLGIWQLNRLEERREANRIVEEVLQNPPIDLDLNAAPSEYQRISITGQFIREENILLGIRSRLGFPGHHLAAPFVIAGSEAVMFVDAGWISNEQRDVTARAALLPEGEVTLSGFVLYDPELPDLLRSPETTERRDQWQTIDPERLASQIGRDVLPFYLEWQFERAADAPATAPRYQTSIELDEGSHLGYAIQWFIFSSIGFIGAAVLYFRKEN